MSMRIEWIDKHCHALPQLDDGAKSPAESGKMLRSMWSQGVREVWLTPHFYAHQESLDYFLERRDRSFASMEPLLQHQQPLPGDLKSLPVGSPVTWDSLTVRLGAEVYLSPALPQVEDPARLAVQGTDYLLLELPWSDLPAPQVYAAVEAFCRRFEGQVILAHIERYDYLYDENWLRVFADLGVEFQCNLEIVFYPEAKKERIYSYMREGKIAHLGSDAHNMGQRAPVITEPFKQLIEVFGHRHVEAMANGLFSKRM